MCDERATKAQKRWETIIIIFRDHQRLHGPAVDHTGHDSVLAKRKKWQIMSHVCRRRYSFIFISLPSVGSWDDASACALARASSDNCIHFVKCRFRSTYMIMECVASCRQLGLWFSEAKNWPNNEQKKNNGNWNSRLEPNNKIIMQNSIRRSAPHNMWNRLRSPDSIDIR